MQQAYDVVIVGGGMVGAALASALKNTELSVAVIEQHMPEAYDASAPHDLRVSALSHGSEAFLTDLGAWPSLERWRVCPYKQMKVWELNEQWGATLFDADDIGASHLGYIVENRLIQLALLETLEGAGNISLINDSIANIDYQASGSTVTLAQGSCLKAGLLVAADGAQSRVRAAAHIGVHRWDYEQGAMVINVTTDFEQQEITWQQFTPEGPRALLPLSGQNASLVWYDHPDRLRALMALDDEALLAAIVANFPSALGQLTGITAKGWFPLARQHAQQYFKDGIALVGDAAHTINPLAGQGVNIGLLDAKVLAECLISAVANQEELGATKVLAQYEKKRRQHNRMMMQTMDLFYKAFSNDHLPLKVLRNAALGVAGNLPFARKAAIRVAMGQTGF